MLPREQRDALLSRIASLDKAIRLAAIREAGNLSYDGGALAGALMHRLADSDREIAKAAEDALVRIGPGSLPAISPYFFDQTYKWEVIGVMERLAKETLDRLDKFRRGAAPEVVARIDAVMRHAEPAVPELLRAMSRGSAELMGLASAVLTRLGVIAVSTLAAEVRADQFDTRNPGDEWRITNPAALAAAAVLAKIGLPAKEAMLEALRANKRSQVRHEFEAGLAALGDEVTTELRVMLRSNERHGQLSAINVFRQMKLGGLGAIKELFPFFSSTDEELRARAGEAVVNLLDTMPATCKHYGLDSGEMYLPAESEIFAVATGISGRQPLEGFISLDGETGAAGACAFLLAELARKDRSKRRVAARIIYRMLLRPDMRIEEDYVLKAFVRLGLIARSGFRRLSISKKPERRCLALKGFAKMHPTRAAAAMDTLVTLLGDTEPEVQVLAAGVLWRIKRKADAAVAVKHMPPLPRLTELLPKLLTYEQCEDQRVLNRDGQPSPLRVGLWLLGPTAHRAEIQHCEAAHRALALLAMTVSTQEPIGIDTALTMLESRLSE